jgi:hypothetical protein
VDWQSLAGSLDRGQQAVLHCLLAGQELTTLMPRLGRSRSALQADKRRLGELIRAHFGPDVVAQAQSRPPWRANVEAERAKHAARLDRAWA